MAYRAAAVIHLSCHSGWLQVFGLQGVHLHLRACLHLTYVV